MASVSKRKWTTKEGRQAIAWRVQYYLEDGRRKSKDFEKRKDADEFVAAIGAELIAGRHVHDTDSVTVSEAIVVFLEAAEKLGLHGRGKVEPKTLRGYKEMLTNHVEPYLGALTIARLDERRVTAWRDVDMLGERKNGEPGETPNTTMVALSRLRALCKYAKSRGWMKGENPCDDVKVIIDRRHKRQISVPSHADVELLLKTSKVWLTKPPKVERARRAPITPYQEKPGRWRIRWTSEKGKRDSKIFATFEDAEVFAHEINQATTIHDDAVTPRMARLGHAVVKFAVRTGCRISEIRGAPKAGFNAEKKTFRVYQRADENGEIGFPKSFSGRRVIPLSAALVVVLKDMAASSDGALLMPSEVGTPFGGSNFYDRYWRPLLKACGLDKRWSGEEVDELGQLTKCGFHFLRHYHASLMIQRGMKPKELSEHMGHSGIEITMNLYGHLFSDNDALAHKRAMVTGEA